MPGDAQDIKDKIDLVDFIRNYTPLLSAGRNFKGLCPFHKEKTPSFVVSPEKQVWHCFGCGAGGDLIKFLMQYENLEFLEALKILAEKAGIELARLGPDQKQFNVLYDINRAAKDFFYSKLREANPYAETALAYLLGRGIRRATIDEFEIGLAPAVSDALSRHLSTSGFSITDIERAGFVLKSDRGTYWDRFRDRIMFPLYNQFGKVIGFTGRILPGNEDKNIGKYVNSPETPIFNKSKLLFGLHKSKEGIRDSKTAVLVEGQMDFLMMWQDGIRNAVATSGTALTTQHLAALKRLAENLILVFDQDEAGRAATEKTFELAGGLDFNISILNYTNLPESDLKDKDPADIVRHYPGLVAELITQAKPAMEYYIDFYFTNPASDVVSRKAGLRRLLSKIKKLFSAIERAHWLKVLTRKSGLDERVLVEEMERLHDIAAVRHKEEGSREEAPQPVSRKDRISHRLLGMALTKAEFLDNLQNYREYLPEPYRLVFNHFRDGQSLAADLQPIADLVHLRSGLEIGDDVSSKKEFLELLRNLKLAYLKEKRETLRERLQSAEVSRDERAIIATLAEFDSISKEMQNS